MMVYIFNRLKLFKFLHSYKHKLRTFENRQYHLNKVYRKEKFTVELQPELQNDLESGEVKHRKHPGIRKIQPVSMPENLRASIDNILIDENEKKLFKKSIEVRNHLLWRRQPIEKEDIDRKIQARIPEFEAVYGNEYEQLSEILTKQQLKELRKSLNLEAGRWKPVEYDRYTSLAYLVGRLAPNFASASYVFNELMKINPEFKPNSYFDFGSGVGSALWAAHTKWSDSMKEYFCIDVSSHMNELCQNLITGES